MSLFGSIGSLSRSINSGLSAKAEIAAYGSTSLPVWVLIVSFNGNTWINFSPAEDAQSAINFRSVKSPHPKERLLRSENTGMLTPAPRHPLLFVLIKVSVIFTCILPLLFGTILSGPSSK